MWFIAICIIKSYIDISYCTNKSYVIIAQMEWNMLEINYRQLGVFPSKQCILLVLISVWVKNCMLIFNAVWWWMMFWNI